MRGKPPSWPHGLRPVVAPGEGEEPALGELTAPFAFQPEEHTAGPRSRRSEVFTASACGVCPLVPAWPGALNPGEPCSASWAIDQSTASRCSAGSFRGSALEFPAACSPHWARGCGCSPRAPCSRGIPQRAGLGAARRGRKGGGAPWRLVFSFCSCPSALGSVHGGPSASGEVLRHGTKPPAPLDAT